MKVLFLGDVTARSGRNIVLQQLPILQKQYGVDFTVVNAENSAHGKGITIKIYRSLIEAGIDVITLGNHAFSKADILNQLEECRDLVFPANLEPSNQAKHYIVKEVNGKKIAVINLLGSVFMDVTSQSPFSTMDALLEEIQADIFLVDFHAETTSEKRLFFELYRDRVQAVIGTHTHIQTADEQVKDGCAFISDVGMCGPYDSVIGRSIEEVKRKIVDGETTHFTPAEGDAILCGCVITIDDSTNRATAIERIQMRPKEEV